MVSHDKEETIISSFLRFFYTSFWTNWRIPSFFNEEIADNFVLKEETTADGTTLSYVNMPGPGGRRCKVPKNSRGSRFGKGTCSGKIELRFLDPDIWDDESALLISCGFSPLNSALKVVTLPYFRVQHCHQSLLHLPKRTRSGLENYVTVTMNL